MIWAAVASGGLVWLLVPVYLLFLLVIRVVHRRSREMAEEPGPVEVLDMSDDDLISTLRSVILTMLGLTRDVRRLSVRQRTDRFVLWVSVIGLCADLLLSGVFVLQHRQQNCLDTIRSKGAAIAASDRVNVDQLEEARHKLFTNDGDLAKLNVTFYKQIKSVRTESGFHALLDEQIKANRAQSRAVAVELKAWDRYMALRAANDAQRKKIGQATKNVCPLFWGGEQA
jgi:hypothetical protein